MIHFHFLDGTPCQRTLRKLIKRTPIIPPRLSWAALFGV